MKFKMLSSKTQVKIFSKFSLLILLCTQFRLSAQDNQRRNLFSTANYSLSSGQTKALQGILSQESTIEATVVAIEIKEVREILYKMCLISIPMTPLNII